MPATVQLNTRIDPEIKRQGDAVFSAAGLSSSAVVRSVWEEAARTQKVPDCVQSLTSDVSERVSAIREGLGIARRALTAMGVELPAIHVDYERAHDEMYDDLAEKIHGQLA